MPMHDWTRVDPNDYFAFQVYWTASLASALNRGRLPDDYMAMSDHATSPVPRFRVAVKQFRNRQTVAVVEIVASGDKAKLRDFSLLVEDVVRSLRLGTHLMLIDPFPQGLHSRVWQEFTGTKAASTKEKPVSLVSYQVGGTQPAAYVDEVAFGSDLPEMPLFLTEDKYIPLPLEESYRTAWDGFPAPLRKLLESR